ncbi:MAG: UDP-N-acetylglucosamine--N-acetylmuramyl-(pentapeptide) pyrophosphoryl-undecaprenol N-acetylglucosamine transferase [Planctomycetota bacterium]
MTAASTLGVLFAGGGSGGHLFPALAVAEQLRLMHPGVATRFLAADRAIDRSILEAAAVDFTQSPAAPLAASPRGLLRFASRWPRAVRDARRRLDDLAAEQGAAVLVAVGGFVAAPAAFAAPRSGPSRVPVIMLNLDAVPGKANRLIATRADRILTTADLRGAARTDRWQRLPPIVRRDALAPSDPAECRSLLSLDPERPMLFITGASQGAGSINAFLEAFLDRHAGDLVDRGWQALHQAGPTANTADLSAAYDRAGVPARVVPFVEQIGLAWGAATAAVARAAAGTVGEVTVNRVPTLFLPYPYHKDQHQLRNAEPLESAGAALIATDHVHAESTLAAAGPMLRDLILNEPRRQAITDRLREISPADPLEGARRVAQEVLGLAGITPPTPSA